MASLLNEIFHLQLAAGLRQAMEELARPDNVKPGVRVVRGPDWKWDEQDGGEGHVGTVVELKSAGREVVVCWDSGSQYNYRSGVMGQYDLRIVDNRPTGAVHLGSRCNGCGEQNIKGMKWRCSVCRGVVDLCTKCFMADKHIASHAFIRFNEPSSDGERVRKRADLNQKQMKGIFAGTKVQKGKDWRWTIQDRPRHQGVSCDVCGEEPIVDARWKCRICPNYDLCTDCYNGNKHSDHPFLKIPFPGATPVDGVPRDQAAAQKAQMLSLLTGKLISVRTDPPPGEVIGEDDEQPGWVEVKWPGSTKNSYRLGADGKVDLKYTSATSGGFYYKETLPVLGKPEEEGVEPEPEPEPELEPEDKEPSAPPAPAAPHQPSLPRQPSPPPPQPASRGWGLGASQGEFDRPFRVNDRVKVTKGQVEFMTIQKQKEGRAWLPSMVKLSGKEGRVVSIMGDGDIEVEFGSSRFTLDPTTCSHVGAPSAESQRPAPSSSAQYLPRRSQTSAPSSRAAGAMVPIPDTELAEGDQIQVNIGRDQLEVKQKQSVGWNPEMAEVIGRVGKVTMSMDTVVMVVYPGRSKQLPFVRSVITKVVPAEEGQYVRISNDLEKVKKFQLEVGQWNAGMTQLVGKSGRIVSVVEENKVQVQVAGENWILNPRICVITDPLPDPEPKPNTQPQSKEEVLKCEICYDKQKCIVFNCGHTACDTCSKRMRDCHVCRIKITNRMKVFF